MKIQKKIVSRLDRVNFLIRKYAHTWSALAGGSNRMYSWIYEYNDLKKTFPHEWLEFCTAVNAAPDHDGFDCLA